MIKPIKLPTHEQSAAAVNQNGYVSPIQTFIYDNEPADVDQAALFRKQFREALNFATLQDGYYEED